MAYNSSENKKEIKTTSFKEGVIKSGKYIGKKCFTGYRLTKGGLMSILVVPYKGSETKKVTTKSKGVTERTNLMALITLNGITTNHTFMWYPSERKGYILNSTLMASLNGSGYSKKNVRISGFFGNVPTK